MIHLKLPFFLFLLLLPSTSQAGEAEKLIAMLGQEITQSENGEEKSMLHIYRARQYFRLNDWEKAEEDYNRALELNHKGWIHLERGHFFMARKKYSLAYEEARAAKEEVPTLSLEADQILEKAGLEIQKKYEAANPITIVMDNKVDPNRKTRFDVLRSRQGAAVQSRSSQSRVQEKADKAPVVVVTREKVRRS